MIRRLGSRIETISSHQSTLQIENLAHVIYKNQQGESSIFVH